MNEDLYDEYLTKVGATAREVGKYYLTVTSYPDIEQELWALVFRKADIFRAYLQTPTMAGVALRRHAHAFCEKQRSLSLGQEPEEFNVYSPAVVRALLPDIFHYEDWQSFSQKGDASPKAKRLEATSDRLAMLIDVKTAVDKLGERSYNIIIARFKYGFSDDRLGEMLEIVPDSVSSAVTRAVKEVVKLLNPAIEGHEYVATRRVKSNAAARAELDNSW